MGIVDVEHATAGPPIFRRTLVAFTALIFVLLAASLRGRASAGGDEFPVANDTYPQSNPAIALAPGGVSLVAWETLVGGPTPGAGAPAMGSRIEGALLRPDGATARRVTFPDEPKLSDHLAAVTFDGRRFVVLVTRRASTLTHAQLAATFVRRDGTPGTTVAIVPSTGDWEVVTAASDQAGRTLAVVTDGIRDHLVRIGPGSTMRWIGPIASGPGRVVPGSSDVAYNPRIDRWLVAWRKPDGRLEGRFANSNGFAGRIFLLQRVNNQNPPAVGGPSIAARGQGFLLAFQYHNRFDVYGVHAFAVGLHGSIGEAVFLQKGTCSGDTGITVASDAAADRLVVAWTDNCPGVTARESKQVYLNRRLAPLGGSSFTLYGTALTQFVVPAGGPPRALAVYAACGFPGGCDGIYGRILRPRPPDGPVRKTTG